MGWIAPIVLCIVLKQLQDGSISVIQTVYSVTAGWGYCDPLNPQLVREVNKSPKWEARTQRYNFNWLLLLAISFPGTSKEIWEPWIFNCKIHNNGNEANININAWKSCYYTSIIIRLTLQLHMQLGHYHPFWGWSPFISLVFAYCLNSLTLELYHYSTCR